MTGGGAEFILGEGDLPTMQPPFSGSPNSSFFYFDHVVQRGVGQGSLKQLKMCINVQLCIMLLH